MSCRAYNIMGMAFLREATARDIRVGRRRLGIGVMATASESSRSFAGNRSFSAEGRNLA